MINGSVKTSHDSNVNCIVVILCEHTLKTHLHRPTANAKGEVISHGNSSCTHFQAKFTAAWFERLLPPQTKFAKVMFLQVSVCPRGGMCGCQGGVHGCWGVCVVAGGACVAKGGMRGEGGHAWDMTRYDQ